MEPQEICLAVITVLVHLMRFANAGNQWPGYNAYGNNQHNMPHNMYFNNMPDFGPQNYHFQQMNGNQLVSRGTPPPCNCIKLRFCNPVMDMARQMYSGFIADYINSQLQVIACNYIDGEMAVCCPSNNNLNREPDSREKRGNGSHRHGGHGRHGHGHIGHSGHSEHSDKQWIWDADEDSKEAQTIKPQQYPQNMYTSYPIQGFYPYSNNPFLNKNKAPFYASHEDPLSMKNCPPAFSNEFKLPSNHTFYKEPESITTPISRIEIVTSPAPPTPGVPSEMQAKMSLINDESCGRSVGSRIIGGEDAGVGRFSWMGRIAYRNKTSGRVSYRCAGSLISDRYILTAGHCVSNLVESLEVAMIRLGDVDEEQDNECNDDGFCLQEEDFEIDKIIVHPNYNNPRYANDIALIRLKQSTAASNSIGTICLPIGQYQTASNAISSGRNGIIAGWGARSRISEAQSTMLQWIRLPFVDTTECASFYANYTSSFRSRIMISNSQLCIQGRENGDACAGDSGGPLMNEAELNNDKFILLGLVSFGPRMCGLSNFPGVYTRTSSYMEWILKNIEA